MTAADRAGTRTVSLSSACAELMPGDYGKRGYATVLPKGNAELRTIARLPRAVTSARSLWLNAQ
jgi:hypothetical protein